MLLPLVPAIGYVAISRAFTVQERPRMFAILSTAWVVPGLVGPVLAERIAQGVGWRWVFLGLIPLVLAAGAVVVPAMMRLGPVDDVEAVTGLVSQAYATRFRFLPVVVNEQEVTIATAEPYANDWEPEIARVLKRSVRRVLALVHGVAGTRCASRSPRGPGGRVAAHTGAFLTGASPPPAV